VYVFLSIDIDVTDLCASGECGNIFQMPLSPEAFEDLYQIKNIINNLVDHELHNDI
jgi:hypothetical protein